MKLRSLASREHRPLIGVTTSEVRPKERVHPVQIRRVVLEGEGAVAAHRLEIPLVGQQLTLVESGLAAGERSDEIAERLFLSAETVRTHVRNAMRKLEARSRVHAVIVALQRGELNA